jgi:hypothetical protein
MIDAQDLDCSVLGPIGDDKVVGEHGTLRSHRDIGSRPSSNCDRPLLFGACDLNSIVNIQGDQEGQRPVAGVACDFRGAIQVGDPIPAGSRLS